MINFSFLTDLVVEDIVPESTLLNIVDAVPEFMDTGDADVLIEPILSFDLAEVSLDLGNLTLFFMNMVREGLD